MRELICSEGIRHHRIFVNGDTKLEVLGVVTHTETEDKYCIYFNRKNDRYEVASEESVVMYLAIMDVSDENAIECVNKEKLPDVEKPSYYNHFKDKKYLVYSVAYDTKGEKFVVYKAMYGDQKSYIRPYDMFMSEVDREKYPDVEQQFRFEHIENL